MRYCRRLDDVCGSFMLLFGVTIQTIRQSNNRYCTTYSSNGRGLLYLYNTKHEFKEDCNHLLNVRLFPIHVPGSFEVYFVAVRRLADIIG